MAPVPMSRAAAGTRRIATVAAQLKTRVAAKMIRNVDRAQLRGEGWLPDQRRQDQRLEVEHL
jgi:hypothetical protein